MGLGHPEIPPEAGHDGWMTPGDQPSHAEADTATTQQREVLLDHDEAAWLCLAHGSRIESKCIALGLLGPTFSFPSLCLYYIELLLYNVHDSLYLDSSYLDSLSDIRFMMIHVDFQHVVICCDML